jgi:hypothetical protein
MNAPSAQAAIAAIDIYACLNRLFLNGASYKPPQFTAARIDS